MDCIRRPRFNRRTRSICSPRTRSRDTKFGQKPRRITTSKRNFWQQLGNNVGRRRWHRRYFLASIWSQRGIHRRHRHFFGGDSFDRASHPPDARGSHKNSNPTHSPDSRHGRSVASCKIRLSDHGFAYVKDDFCRWRRRCQPTCSFCSRLI